MRRRFDTAVYREAALLVVGIDRCINQSNSRANRFQTHYVDVERQPYSNRIIWAPLLLYVARVDWSTTVLWAAETPQLPTGFFLTGLQSITSDNHVVSDCSALFRRAFDKSPQNSVPKTRLLPHFLLRCDLHYIFVKTHTAC